MKNIAKKVLTVVCVPFTCTLASFDAMDQDDEHRAIPKAPPLPAMMRSGLGTPLMHQNLQEEIEQERRRIKDRALAQEFAQVGDAKVKAHRDHFMNVTLEQIPGWLKGYLPQGLSKDLSQKITFTKADASAKTRESSQTFSVARFLNEIQMLQGNESPVEQSLYLVRLGFALKDATLEGKSAKDMRTNAAICFYKASAVMEKAVEQIDDMYALANARLSVAQTYYWAGALASNGKSQLSLFEKARAIAGRAFDALGGAPEEIQAALRVSHNTLDERLTFAQTYVETRNKYPSLPSLYEWNRMLSALPKDAPRLTVRF